MVVFILITVALAMIIAGLAFWIKYYTNRRKISRQKQAK